MNVRDCLKDYVKPVVIVHYRIDGQYNGGSPPQNPACLLQVTLDSSKVSPSKKYIRLGAKADEIVGWTPLDSLEVDEVLGTLGEDGETVTLIPEVPYALDTGTK